MDGKPGTVSSSEVNDTTKGVCLAGVAAPSIMRLGEAVGNRKSGAVGEGRPTTEARI